MRTIRIKLYKFSELSKDAQENAIENLSDINFSSDCWDTIYEDAKNVYCEINGFDIDRGSYCDLQFTDSATQVANKILSEHGEMCETYKTAHNFLAEYDNLVKKYADETNPNVVAEENEYDFDNEAYELEEEFRKSLSEDYRIMLSHEYDYMSSREAIIETIEANEYEFTKDGKLA